MYLLIIFVIIIVICILFGYKQENFGCSAGQTCCLQGQYGTPPNCQQCPVDKPSSPRTRSGGPDENCSCPNETIDTCFACDNLICNRFNPSTGICTPVCPNCSVTRRRNKLVPKCD